MFLCYALVLVRERRTERARWRRGATGGVATGVKTTGINTGVTCVLWRSGRGIGRKRARESEGKLRLSTARSWPMSWRNGSLSRPEPHLSLPPFSRGRRTTRFKSPPHGERCSAEREFVALASADPNLRYLFYDSKEKKCVIRVSIYSIT